MDPRVILTAFTTLFLAEMGDKTQLAVLALAASSKQPLAVFLGAAAALLAVTAIGVLVGGGLSRIIPTAILNKAAALAFIVIGVFLLLGKSS